MRTSRRHGSRSAATSTTSWSSAMGASRSRIGDVTGHGIEATADMAMAKFAFRSPAREHPEPGDFLQSANEVVVSEIAPGKFILSCTCSSTAGRQAAAAGRASTVGSWERTVPDGSRGAGSCRDRAGPAIRGSTRDPGRRRRGRALHGRSHRERAATASCTASSASIACCPSVDLSANELAQVVLDDCRAFARGELADDCAVVVVRRTA